MDEYRVIVWAITEQYEYVIEASSPVAAEEQGIESAISDGMSPFNHYTTEVNAL